MKLNLLCISITCIVLASCGGGSSGSEGITENPIASPAQESPATLEFDFSDITDGINKLGVIRVTVEQPRKPSFNIDDVSTYALATFAQLDSPLTKSAMESIATIEGANKTVGCQYHDVDQNSFELFNPNDLYPARTLAKKELSEVMDYPGFNISAGDQLTLSTSAGDIIPMSQYAGPTSTYINDNLASGWKGWPTTGSIIDIPGNTFPAVSAFVISTVEPIMNLTSIDSDPNDPWNPYEPVSGGTLTWTAAQEPQSSVITIVARGNGVLVCHTPDSGSFTWPDEVDTFFIDHVTIERTSFSYEQIDDAMLVSSATLRLDIPAQ